MNFCRPVRELSLAPFFSAIAHDEVVSAVSLKIYRYYAPTGSLAPLASVDLKRTFSAYELILSDK